MKKYLTPELLEVKNITEDIMVLSMEETANLDDSSDSGIIRIEFGA